MTQTRLIAWQRHRMTWQTYSFTHWSMPTTETMLVGIVQWVTNSCFRRCQTYLPHRSSVWSQRLKRIRDISSSSSSSSLLSTSFVWTGCKRHISLLMVFTYYGSSVVRGSSLQPVLPKESITASKLYRHRRKVEDKKAQPWTGEDSRDWWKYDTRKPEAWMKNIANNSEGALWGLRNRKRKNKMIYEVAHLTKHCVERKPPTRLPLLQVCVEERRAFVICFLHRQGEYRLKHVPSSRRMLRALIVLIGPCLCGLIF